MARDAELTRSLQENLLLVLVWDDAQCRIVRAAVDPELWDTGFFPIVEACAAYIDKYGRAPREHVLDITEALTEDRKDKPRADYYKRQVAAILNSKDTVNSKYAVDQLQLFRRRQGLKKVMVDSVPLLKSEDPKDLDEIEARLNKVLRDRIEVFDDGLVMSDTRRALRFMSTATVDEFITAIPELDKNGAAPARKTLWLIIGVAKRGKTWAMIHLGKANLIGGKKVLHVTLENSEELTSQRYVQALFELLKRDMPYNRTHLLKKAGEYRDTERARDKSFESLRDTGMEAKLRRRMLAQQAMLDRLRVKEFPTAELTIEQLEAYLDGLEVRHGWVPDLLLVDSADLMKLDISEYRLSMGANLRRLRGLGVRRNMAVATVKQSNREGADQKVVRGKHAAEDWSAIGTVDIALTYNQTEPEHDLNLARIYIDSARGDVDRLTVLITQDYSTGQFVLESAMLPSVNDYLSGLARREPEPTRR